MAALATVGAAAGAEGAREVGVMTGREMQETVDPTVAHVAARVAVATAILRQHVTTLKPVSLHGGVAKSATGDRSGDISCVCMCATI